MVASHRVHAHSIQATEVLKETAGPRLKNQIPDGLPRVESAQAALHQCSGFSPRPRDPESTKNKQTTKKRGESACLVCLKH